MLIIISSIYRQVINLYFFPVSETTEPFTSNILLYVIFDAFFVSQQQSISYFCSIPSVFSTLFIFLFYGKEFWHKLNDHLATDNVLETHKSQVLDTR